MKYIDAFSIFESSNTQWVTSEEEIKEYFYDLHESIDCNLSIVRFFMSKDLKMFSKATKAGYYPGYIIQIDPKFNGLDFNKHILYLKYVSECNDRLSEKYQVYNIDPRLNSINAMSYKITFLDSNFESIIWSDDLVYQQKFIDISPNYTPKYGSVKKIKNESSIIFTYIQPVSKVKAIIDIQNFKSDLERRYSDFDIQIDPSYTTSGSGTNLINSITIYCKGKKKSISDR